MTRNPWAIALWVGAGFALVLAVMLTIVVAELTDYESYDVAGVASIEAWIRLLVGIAAITSTGAVVLAGIERMLLRSLAAQSRAERSAPEPSAR